MAKKTEDKLNYKQAVRSLKEQGPQRLYLLWGPEDYLREYYVSELKKLCLPDGEESFSLKRMNGPELDPQELQQAIDAVPFLSERSFVELRGIDLNHIKDADKIQAVLSGAEVLALLPSGIAATYLAGSYALPVTILLYVLGALFALYLQLTYGLSYFILLDYPQGKPRQVLKASRKMMKGNRGVLFYLYLSFIPLFLLGILSLFIGDVYVLSYFYSTEAAFYRSLMAIRSGNYRKAPAGDVQGV